MTDVDQLLTGYADTWRQAEPPPPELAAAIGGIPGRRRMLLPLAAAACVAAIATTVAVAIPLLRSDHPAPQQTTGPVAAAAPIVRLTTIVETAAAACGDRNPASAQAVRTTRDAANRYLMGAGTNERTPVWAIEIRGKFSCVTTGPPGHGPATGTVLQEIVDARTWRTTDGGVSSTGHDLSKLGKVVVVPTTYAPPDELLRTMTQDAIGPFRAQAVYCDWPAADQALGLGTQPHDFGPVWVVQGIGTFRSAGRGGPALPPGSTPPPEPPPTTEVLIFPARAGRTLYSGATAITQGERPIDLSKLGTVINLTP